MTDAFQCILDVLGKSSTDDAFDKLAEALGERPEILVETPGTLEYHCEVSGFHLTFIKNRAHFAYAYLGHGKKKSYEGNLPNKLAWGDNPDVVEQKLGVVPIFASLFPGTRPEDPMHLQEIYLQRQFQFKCLFDFSTGGLDSIVISLEAPGEQKPSDQGVRNQWLKRRQYRRPVVADSIKD